jgi:ferredoxin
MCTIEPLWRLGGVRDGPVALGAGRAQEEPVGVSVSIDPDLCIGSGDCGRLLPRAFELREDLGVSVPLPGAADADLETLLRAAVGCPTQAIRVVTADGTVLHASNSG